MFQLCDFLSLRESGEDTSYLKFVLSFQGAHHRPQIKNTITVTFHLFDQENYIMIGLNYS